MLDFRSICQMLEAPYPVDAKSRCRGDLGYGGYYIWIPAVLKGIVSCLKSTIPHSMIYRKKLTWFECRLPKIMILESKWKHWVILLFNSPSHLIDKLLIHHWKIFRYAEVPNSSSADTKTVASVTCIQRTPSSIAITSLLTNHLTVHAYMMCLIKAWRYIQVSFTLVLHLTEECTIIWRNVPSRNSGRKISFTWKYWRMHRGSCLEAIRSSFVDEVLCIRWERAPGSRKRFRSGFHLSEKTV